MNVNEVIMDKTKHHILFKCINKSKKLTNKIRNNLKYKMHRVMCIISREIQSIPTA